MRFRELEFQDLVDFYDNKRVPLSSLERENMQGPYRYYGAQGVIDYINNYIFDGEFVLVAEDGANLVTRKEPIAQIARGQFWVNNHAHVVSAKKGISTNTFINVLLNSNNLSGYVTGAAQPKLSQSNLRKAKFVVPNYAIQREIDRIICAYNDLIENNRRRIQLLEESARLLYREWFVYLRFPGHEHVKVVGSVPEGWDYLPLPDAVEINSRTPVEKNKAISYVPMSSLSETGMTVDISDFEIREKHTNVKFIKNDTLLARITPCLENGKTAFVYFLEEDDVACGSTEFIVLREKQLPPEYIYCLSRSYEFREHAIKSMTGSSGRQRVQVSAFNDYYVYVPPKGLLEQFNEFAKNCFAQIKLLTRQNTQLTNARDLLLPRLMNGDISV